MEEKERNEKNNGQPERNFFHNTRFILAKRRRKLGIPERPERFRKEKDGPEKGP